MHTSGDTPPAHTGDTEGDPHTYVAWVRRVFTLQYDTMHTRMIPYTHPARTCRSSRKVVPTPIASDCPHTEYTSVVVRLATGTPCPSSMVRENQTCQDEYVLTYEFVLRLSVASLVPCTAPLPLSSGRIPQYPRIDFAVDLEY